MDSRPSFLHLPSPEITTPGLCSAMVQTQGFLHTRQTPYQLSPRSPAGLGNSLSCLANHKVQISAIDHELWYAGTQEVPRPT